MRFNNYLVAAALGALLITSCERRTVPAPDASVAEADQLQPLQPVARLEPGTTIGDSLPPDWSHLILTTRPRFTSGDLDRVSASLLDAVSKYDTTVLLRTEPDPAHPGQFRLGACAVGLGTEIGGKEVIVTKATAEQLGVKLGSMERIVLGQRDKDLDGVFSPAVTATMGIVDIPTAMIRDGRARQLVMRYASLVDSKDGGVATLFWMLEPDQNGYRFVGDTLLLLEPNQTMDWNLHVDASQFSFGMPGADAFAGTSLPQGRQLTLPEALKKPASEKFFSANSAARLEQQLREVLPPSSTAPGTVR